MCRIYFEFFVLFALINTGLALQCWKCDTELDGKCGEQFNAAEFKQNSKNSDNFSYRRNDPYLGHCVESLSNYDYNEKSVCIKKVYRGPRTNDVATVERKCIRVSKKLNAGECPQDSAGDRGRIVDYCGTCEFDECNTAAGIKNNLIFVVIPLILLYLLQK